MMAVALAYASGAPTLDDDMPARLTIEQAAAYIEAKINENLEPGERRRRVTPSVIRRMMALKKPAVAAMKRTGKYELTPRRHWRFTLASVERAAASWPAPEAGKPRAIPPALEAHILDLRHRDGMTLQQIADELQRAGVANPSGGRIWDPSSILRVIVRHGGEDGGRGNGGDQRSHKAS